MTRVPAQLSLRPRGSDAAGPSGAGRFAGRALLVAAFALCAETAWAFSVLPETVASHFDLAGRADGWSSKSGFLALYLALSLGIAALFGGLGWLLPRLPDALINLPNKDYWLAPERRAATLQRACDALRWMGVATLGLLLALLHLTVRANLREPPVELGPYGWVPVAVYLVVLAWLTVAMLLSYRRPKTA